MIGSIPITVFITYQKMINIYSPSDPEQRATIVGTVDSLRKLKEQLDEAIQEYEKLQCLTSFTFKDSSSDGIEYKIKITVDTEERISTVPAPYLNEHKCESVFVVTKKSEYEDNETFESVHRTREGALEVVRAGEGRSQGAVTFYYEHVALHD